MDQRLGFATPVQCVPHCRSGSQHGAGCIDGVAAIEENLGPGRGGNRFARDGNPVLAIKNRLLGQDLRRNESGHGDCYRGNHHYASEKYHGSIIAKYLWPGSNWTKKPPDSAGLNRWSHVADFGKNKN